MDIEHNGLKKKENPLNLSGNGHEELPEIATTWKHSPQPELAGCSGMETRS